MSEQAIRGARCARLAAGWSVVFAAAHFFWALGGSTLLDVSAGPELAAERPAWFVAGGLWGVGVLCLVGAAVGWALSRPRRPGPLGKAVRLAGVAAGAVLLVRGLVVEALLLTGSGGLEDTVGPDQRWWTLLLWNPWFIAGGIAFTVAGAAYRRPSAPT
ncbi:DUF3995 domain-containing protein [Actinosynnema sp. NPDC059797]